MSLQANSPFGDDGDDQVAREAARGVGEFERYLAAYRAPALPPEAVEAVVGPDPGDELVDEPGDELVDTVTGETKQVRELAAAVAEGERLRELYTRQVALNLDSKRVLRRRLQGQEAAKLHMLARVPAVLALQAAKVLRVVNIGAFTALVLALGWSTAGVHSFAAAGAPAWSPGWVVGWFVEPFLSLALLAIVGAKAYLAVRGHIVNSQTLDRIEWVFLGLTLAMNIYPTIPAPVGRVERFELSDLVLHALGPIVAVSIVRGLPVLWAEFSKLDHGLTGLPAGRSSVDTGDLTGTPDPSLYRKNTDSRTPVVTDKVRDLTAKAVTLIETGQLSGNPSANAIRKALGCGTDQARAVRDRIKNGGA